MLRLALQTGSSSALGACIRRGDALDARDDRGRTPLMLAASRGHMDCCRILLEHGSERHATDHAGATAADLAQAAGFAEVAALVRALPSLAEQEAAHDLPAAPDDGSARQAGGDEEVPVLDWEPEEEPVAPDNDPSVAARAAATQEDIRSHVHVDPAADWSDIEIDLPSPDTLARQVALELAAGDDLQRLLLAAVDAGWVNPQQVDEVLLASHGQADPDDRAALARHVLRGLGDIGVVVDDGAPTLPLDGEEPDDGRRIDVGELFEEIVVTASGRNDPLSLFMRDLRHTGPLLTHAEEIALGSAMREGVFSALEALCSSERSVREMLAVVLDPAFEFCRETGNDAEPGPGVADGPDGPGPDDGMPAPPAVGSGNAWDIDALPEGRPAARVLDVFRMAAERRAGATGADLATARTALRQAVSAMAVSPGTLARLRDRLATGRADPGTLGLMDAGLASAADAHRKLVEANLRLVVYTARKYLHPGMALADLIQEGSIGLMRAADRYDHARGFRFSTYATWWIRQAVSRAVADSARLIRLPVHMSERLRHLHRARDLLHRRTGREPRAGEMAEELGVPASEIAKLLRVPPDAVSLDDDLHDEGRLSARLVDAMPTPEETCSLAQTRAEVAQLLGTLGRKEAAVLRMRFGLGTEAELTLEEVGQALGVTRERVRQIESKALGRLKARLTRMTDTPAREAQDPPTDGDGNGRKVPRKPPASRRSPAGTVAPDAAKTPEPGMQDMAHEPDHRSDPVHADGDSKASMPEPPADEEVEPVLRRHQPRPDARCMPHAGAA